MRLTTCPLDCFDGCSIAVSKDLKLKGNKSHPITQGYLCHHLNHYHTFERIEEARYLGQSISLSAALKILEEQLRSYESSRTLYFKGSGNLGVMQGATKRFFAEHKAVLASGSLCDEAGDAGVCESRGANLCLSPLHVKDADVVIVWGRNPSVTNSHMLPALKGKTLIVIDPVKIDLSSHASLHIQIKPRGDLYLALLLCRLVAMEEMEDQSFLKERTHNYKDFLDFISGIPMRKLLDKSQVNLDEIGELLRLIKGKKVSILVGIGVQKYSFGHSVLRSIDALGAMLGLFGKKGCGVGYLSNSGFGFVSPFKVSAKTEPLPIVNFGKYDLVFIQGGNPLNQMPCTSKVKEGIAKAKCVVYFGLHENETSSKAHLVIPALSFLEKEDLKLSYGHHFIGRMPKLVESPIGLSEYALTQALLKAFGYEPLESEESIVERVIASNSVEQEGFLISKTYEDYPYEKTFYTKSGKFEFLDEFDDDFEDEEGFFLIAAKQNKSLNSQFVTDDYLYVPLCLGLEQEDRVRLTNRYGSAEYSVMPSDKLRDDCLLLHSGAKNANQLTPYAMSQEGNCAIYQEMKVKLEKSQMSDTEILLDDALLLVEQNFYFLHMGEFLGKLSKTEDLNDRSLFVVKKYENDKAYYFNAEIIQELLANARQTNKEEISLFEYFVEFNAFRGICMAMVESLRFDSPFKVFMQKLFGDQYENFFDIVSFVRNVLSHNIHSEIRLSEKDYDGTLKRIRRMGRKADMSFAFQYSLNLPELGAPNDAYIFTCKIDFEKLEEGMPFLEILSMWDLLMLCELCFNLVMTYRMKEEKALREEEEEMWAE